MQILLARFFDLPPYLFKFHSTEGEVSKVPAAGGGGGVVTSDRPTLLFFRAPTPLRSLSLLPLHLHRFTHHTRPQSHQQGIMSIHEGTLTDTKPLSHRSGKVKAI